MLRAAVIGCGGIGSQLQFDSGADRYGVCTHAAAYNSHPNIEIVSFCDINSERLSKAMSSWGVNKGYSDWNELIKESKPDIVSICTSTSTHYDIAVACINSKSVKGVLLEKPVSENINKTKKILEMLEGSSIKVLVNYRRRFLPHLKYLKNLISKKDLGTPTLVRGVYTKGIIHNGSHWIDLLRYFFGDPSWLEAKNRLNDKSKDPGLDVIFGFKSGFQAYLSALDSENYTIFEMDIFFSNGYVKITEGSEKISIYKVIEGYPFSSYNGLNSAESESYYMYNWMSEVVNNLVESVKFNKDPICTIHDGMKSQEIANRAILYSNNTL